MALRQGVAIAITDLLTALSSIGVVPSAAFLLECFFFVVSSTELLLVTLILIPSSSLFFMNTLPLLGAWPPMLVCIARGALRSM